MANEQVNQLLKDGIAAAKAGQPDKARQLLQDAVRRDPRNETAWLWLSSVAQNDKDRIFCLRKLLDINPNNEFANKGLRQLNVLPDAPSIPTSGPRSQPIQRLPPQSQQMPSPPRSQPMQAASQPRSQSMETPAKSQQTAVPGVPVIDERKLNALMGQIDPILQRYQPVPTKALPFEWMKKKRGRVGDSSAAMLRMGVIGGVVLVLALIGIGGFVALRSAGVGIVLIPPTATPFPTLSPTPSATPGLTDTPSPTPRGTTTPGFTPPANVPNGNSPLREPTSVYPNVQGNSVLDALSLINAGKYDEALARLDAERKSLENVKNEPSRRPTYDTLLYYTAILYLRQNNPDRALTILNENPSDTPPHHAALAQVYFTQNDFDRALSEANEAFRKDDQLTDAAIIAARVYTGRRQYPDAIRILNRAIERQPGNAVLLVERGTVQLAASNPKNANDDANLALYAEPRDEPAYILRSKALLALAARVTERDERIQAYGTAVLATKEFLLYYPGETIAWLMLGQGRQGEENLDAAMDAYNQAVVADQKSPAAQQVFIARGQLFLAQRRYQPAFDDFDRALTIDPIPEAHASRLQAALALKNYGAAMDDVDALLKANPNDTGLLLTKLDLLFKSQKYDDASPILSDAFVNGLNGDDKAAAQLYRGILRFRAQTFDKALQDFNDSLAARESGTGHYYRGQVLEALKRPVEAATDYQWVLFWDKVYKYDFAQDAAARLDQALSAIPTLTLTPSQTPTRTLTPTRTDTPTRTLSPTRTPTLVPSDTPTRTDTPGRTLTSTRTPTPTRTPTQEPTDTPTPTPTPTKRQAVVTVTPTANTTNGGSTATPTP